MLPKRAVVRLNGKDLGILWKAPYRVDIFGAVKNGENVLEVKVVNLWVNRMIGDELLPEDSDTVVVSSPDIQNPVAVQYASISNPTGNKLYNKEGLPASPFRTQD